MCIIEGINITTAGMMRHLLLFAALHCSRGIVEYGRLMIFFGAREKRGLGEKKPGFSGIKAALQTQLHETPKKSVAPYKWPATKPLGPGGRTSLIRSVSYIS